MLFFLVVEMILCLETFEVFYKLLLVGIYRENLNLYSNILLVVLLHTFVTIHYKAINIYVCQHYISTLEHVNAD
jgi:hypothetical protein